MEKKKIWIVTELFHPDETAVAYIFTRIADFLSHNYDINIICGPESYDKNKIDFKDNYRISDSIKLYRTKTLKLDKNSLIQRSLKLIFLSLQMSFMLIRKVPKGETVLLSTNPAPLLFMVSIIKKWKKINLHILVHDVFPENTIPAKVFKNDRSILYKSLKFFFDSAYSSADHLIAIGRDMKEVLDRKTERFIHKPYISVVTNWCQPSDVCTYVLRESYLAKTALQNKIVLQYAGNIGRVQGLDHLVNSFILSGNADLQLIIRGTGAMYSSLEKLIKLSNQQNITLLGSYSRDEEISVLSKCDISIVSLSNGMFGLGVPSKTYHLLAVGKPILFIGDPDSEISLLIKENNIGWSVDVNNNPSLSHFLKNLKPRYDNDIVIKGQNARLLAENEYSEYNVLTQLQKQMEMNFKM
jgi:hypothetical protein